MKRFTAVLACCAVAGLVSGCDGADSGGGEPVRIGLRPYLTNAPLYVARDEGFFEEEGLDVHLINMPHSTSQSVPALDQGDLDVIAGSVSIGLLNAIERGRRIRIVADKGHFASEACSPSALVARRDLQSPEGFPSGDWLRGRRIDYTPANHDGYYVDRTLRRAGLGMEDVRDATVPLSAISEAMNKGSIDLTATSEPWLSRLLEEGHKVVAPANEVIPEHQYGVLVFGPTLLEERPEVGRQFLSAYLRGVRRYNRGKTERNLAIVSAWTDLDRPTLLRACWPSIRNDGRVGAETVVEFQRWAVERGHLSRVLEPDEFRTPLPLIEGGAESGR